MTDVEPYKRIGWRPSAYVDGSRIGVGIENRLFVPKYKSITFTGYYYLQLFFHPRDWKLFHTSDLLYDGYHKAIHIGPIMFSWYA